MNREGNLPLRVADHEDYERRNAASQLELHAIYNRHQSVDDALKTVNLIAPNSVVYVEGIQLQPNERSEKDIFILTERLTSYRRNHGIDEKYRKMKKRLIYEYQNYLDDMEEVGEANIGDKYDACLFLELIKKNCQIVTADYNYSRSDMADETLEEMARVLDTSEHKMFEVVETDGDERLYLSHIEEMVTKKRELHDLRENHATSAIVDDALRILSDPKWLEQSVRAPSGRLQAYVCYGAAHSRSLTRKLTDAGIHVTVEDVFQLDEDGYLDSTLEEFQLNYLRRVSNAAFRALSWSLIGDDDDKSPYNTATRYMYHSLEDLNKDNARAVAFVVRCLRIKQLSLSDEVSSAKEYVELVHEYGHEAEIEHL